jgi:hypothetical protein
MSYNRWMYTNGNPVNYTDPSGRNPVNSSSPSGGSTVGECASILVTLALIDGPSPAGDIAGTAFCAALILGVGEGAIEYLQNYAQVPGDVKIDCNWMEWLYNLPESPKITPDPGNEPKFVPLPIPNQKPLPTGTPNPNQGIMTYRGLDGDLSSDGSYYKRPQTSPSQFRVDIDGISTYELEDFPGNKPYGLRLSINIKQPIVQGSIGIVESLPNCTGTFTPQYGGGKRHWSINCSGNPANQQLSSFAKGIGKNNIILNPNWITIPVDRRLP